jgi:hypothetical protein
MSTCDILYPHVHAHARWSFSFRLGSLALQDDAARTVVYFSPWCCRCEGACSAVDHSDYQIHVYCKICANSSGRIVEGESEGWLHTPMSTIC